MKVGKSGFWLGNRTGDVSPHGGQHMGKVKSSRPSLRETREKLLLVRESDRRCVTAWGTAYGQGEKFSA